MATTKALDEDGVVLLASDIKTLSDATYPSNAAIASAYDATAAYSVGDYCLRSGLLYKCNTAIGSGGEAWNSAHWTQTKASDEFGAGGSPYDSDIIADEYDSSSAYSIGDYCVYDDLLFKCNTTIGSGGEAWTAAHWTQTKVSDEFGADSDIIADEYDSTNSYLVGDYCMYNDLLYRCNTEIATGGEAWTSAHWDLTNATDELKYADKLFFYDTIVPISSFTVYGAYANKGYSYSASIPLSGVKLNMVPIVSFQIEDALSGIFAPITSSYNGGIRIFSSGIPDPSLAADIDTSVFLSKVTGSGTMTFAYNSGWDVNPASYGITFSGSPNDGDEIIVVYDSSNSTAVLSVNGSILIPTILCLNRSTQISQSGGSSGGGSGGGTADRPILKSVTLDASNWDSNKSQVVTFSGIEMESNIKVDLQVDNATLNTLSSQGVTSMYAVNNNAEVSIYVTSYAPSTNVTVQCVLTEVDTTSTTVIGDMVCIPAWSEYIDLRTSSNATEGTAINYVDHLGSIQTQSGWAEVFIHGVTKAALTSGTSYKICDLSAYTKSRIGSTYKSIRVTQGVLLINTWDTSSELDFTPSSAISKDTNVDIHAVVPITF